MTLPALHRRDPGEEEGLKNVNFATTIFGLVDCMLSLLMGRRHTSIIMRRLSGGDGRSYSKERARESKRVTKPGNRNIGFIA